MADTKISELALLSSPAASDLLPVVDVSDATMAASGTTKCATLAAIGATLAVAADNVPRVLRLESAAHIDHGKFWPKGETFTTDLGAFLWDAWCVHLGGEYLISDGYGGAHALLWGFAGDGSSMTGNVYNGTGSTSFFGSYAPGPLEWVHVAVGWDGSHKLSTWVNGVCDGLSHFDGPRRAIEWAAGGGGNLFVGGSDHSNGSYKLAFLRGFEGYTPCPTPTVPFLPERHPSRMSGTSVPCAFYCDYTQGEGAVTFADTSPGGYDTLGTGPIFHHGRAGNQQQNGIGDAFTASIASGVMPTREADAGCPLGTPLDAAVSPVEPARTPATPPSGCLAYDSFGRANQTLAHQIAPTLGSTEAGSLGVLAWQAHRVTGQPGLGTFGILGGKAVCTADGTVVAWVPLGTATHDLRAKRSMAASQCGEVGIAFRVVDGSNFWGIYFQASTFFSSHGASRASGIVYTTKVVAGVATLVGSGSAVSTDTWTHLRVKGVGNVITVYTGDGDATWTSVVSFTDSTHSTGQGGGITNLDVALNTINSLARWDEFAAFTAS